MRQYQASATIYASAERIWQILTDAPNYPQWEPGMDHIEGTIAPGQQLKVFTKLSPNRAFPVTVSEFVANQKMTWRGGMPLGLFTGERTFTLTPQTDGSTVFVTREEFKGPLLPLIGRSIPDLSESFQNFADGLKTYAERG